MLAVVESGGLLRPVTKEFDVPRNTLRRKVEAHVAGEPVVKQLARIVPVDLRNRYCDAIKKGDILEFQHISQLCDDKIFFPIDSTGNCSCWSMPMEDVSIRIHSIGYPLCRRLAERICSGTCDCTGTEHGRLILFTSLHLACPYGQLEIVKKCLEQFGRNTVQFPIGTLLTPLMVTSLSDAKDVAPHIASLLIDAGANIDEQVEKGFSALHLSVINNNPELVKLYMQCNANVNTLAFSMSYRNFGNVIVETSGLSPLWFAAKFLPSGSLCEELLLDAGANVTDWCPDYCSLVAVGGKEGFAGVLRYLKSPGFNINYRYPFSSTQLINAIHTYCSYESDDELRRVWFQVIKYYVEMGVDVNAEDDDGRTAIFFCSQEYEVLEFLISHGADVKRVCCDGITPLMDAFKTSEPIHPGSSSCVRLLLENGADPNAISEYGYNPLLHALDYEYQNESDIKLLFEYGMDLGGEYLSLLYESPKPILYIVYEYSDFEVADRFIEYGIDMTKQNWLLDTEHLPTGLIGNDVLYNRLLQLYRNPADLTVLVRNKLRQMFGRSARVVLTQLGLPKALEDFVMCK